MSSAILNAIACIALSAPKHRLRICVMGNARLSNAENTMRPMLDQSTLRKLFCRVLSVVINVKKVWAAPAKHLQHLRAGDGSDHHVYRDLLLCLFACVSFSSVFVAVVVFGLFG